MSPFLLPLDLPTILATYEFHFQGVQHEKSFIALGPGLSNLTHSPNSQFRVKFLCIEQIWESKNLNQNLSKSSLTFPSQRFWLEL